MKRSKYLFTSLILLLFLMLYGCSKNDAQTKADSTKRLPKVMQKDTIQSKVKPKFPFEEDFEVPL